MRGVIQFGRVLHGQYNLVIFDSLYARLRVRSKQLVHVHPLIVEKPVGCTPKLDENCRHTLNIIQCV